MGIIHLKEQVSPRTAGAGLCSRRRAARQPAARRSSQRGVRPAAPPPVLCPAPPMRLPPSLHPRTTLPHPRTTRHAQPYNAHDDMLRATTMEIISTLKELLHLHPLYNEQMRNFIQARGGCCLWVLLRFVVCGCCCVCGLVCGLAAARGVPQPRSAA